MKQVELGEFMFLIPDKFDADKLMKAVAQGKLKKVYNKLFTILEEVEVKEEGKS
jgi:hypothetical protein